MGGFYQCGWCGALGNMLAIGREPNAVDGACNPCGATGVSKQCHTAAPPRMHANVIPAMPLRVPHDSSAAFKRHVPMIYKPTTSGENELQYGDEHGNGWQYGDE